MAIKEIIYKLNGEVISEKEAQPLEIINIIVNDADNTITLELK